MDTSDIRKLVDHYRSQAKRTIVDYGYDYPTYVHAFLKGLKRNHPELTRKQLSEAQSYFDDELFYRREYTIKRLRHVRVSRGPANDLPDGYYYEIGVGDTIRGWDEPKGPYDSEEEALAVARELILTED